MVMPKIFGHDEQGRPLDKRGKVIQKLVPLGGREEATQDKQAQAEAEQYLQEHIAEEQERATRKPPKDTKGMGLGPRKRHGNPVSIIEKLEDIEDAVKST